jgi:hypothetical protein
MKRSIIPNSEVENARPAITPFGILSYRQKDNPEGYSLDLDSTVFERYGEQEGALKGHNPKKHGRPSHHPILAALAEAYFALHGWLCSGNAGTARGVVEFSKEALALLPNGAFIRCLRADSGFFDNKLMEFLEAICQPYIVVARMTKTIKMKLGGVTGWKNVDGDYAVGEFRAKLQGWKIKSKRIGLISPDFRKTSSAFRGSPPFSLHFIG